MDIYSTPEKDGTHSVFISIENLLTDEEIEDYFVRFLANGPVGKIDEGNIRTFGEMAINSGIYTFTFKDGAAVSARFTFVYRWNGQRWLIVEHHSSQMPE